MTVMELARPTLQSLCEVIHQLCGLALGPDKAYLVRHRLAPLVEREGLASFEELLDELHSRGGVRLHAPIIEAITTKETSFFRDRAYFDALQNAVLPDCVQTLRCSGGRRHRIRIWSAGCSTGQEPYSVAMCVHEMLAAGTGDGAKESHFTILATDLSTEALEIAKAGRYREADVARGLSAELLARHFRRQGRQWIVDESLRRMVQFRRFDLLASSAPLGAFDVLLCRNVLIYFDAAARARVLEGLFSQLQVGGWLALGAAENLYGLRHQLERIRLGRAMFYRKSC